MSLIRVRTDDKDRYTDAFVDKNSVVSLNIVICTSSLSHLIIGLNTGKSVIVEFGSITGAEKEMNEIALKL